MEDTLAQTCVVHKQYLKDNKMEGKYIIKDEGENYKTVKLVFKHACDAQIRQNNLNVFYELLKVWIKSFVQAKRWCFLLLHYYSTKKKKSRLKTLPMKSNVIIYAQSSISEAVSAIYMRLVQNDVVYVVPLILSSLWSENPLENPKLTLSFCHSDITIGNLPISQFHVLTWWYTIYDITEELYYLFSSYEEFYSEWCERVQKIDTSIQILKYIQDNIQNKGGAVEIPKQKQTQNKQEEENDHKE